MALEKLHAAVYDSVADTYVYFVGRGLSLLRSGRRFGMILPNKWLRAAYGRALRTLLATAHEPLDLVDFGHAPVFPDADTFPCILVVAAGAPHGDRSLRHTSVPREALKDLLLDAFVAQHGYGVPIVFLRPDGWTLEPPPVARLLEKIRGDHSTLGKIAPDSIFFGIKPGLTEAFFIDQGTRDRLVAEDLACEPLLRKAIRGRNVERWHPDWDGEWLILLKSSENERWPWADAGAKAEQVFADTYPALYRHFKPLQPALEKRQDRGRYWWELRSCSYYEELNLPKIVYQEILFHSSFAWDSRGYLHNNKAFSLRTDQKHLTAILNSSVIWWYMWRTIPHMKDEALAMQAFAVEQLPIPESAEGPTRDLEQLADTLAMLSAERQEHQRYFNSELTANLGIERPSRMLEQFWRWDDASLAAELRRVAAHPPSSRLQTELHGKYAGLAADFRKLLARILQLELQAQWIVFDIYGLNPDEIELQRRTAPPRDPLALAEDEARRVSALLKEML